MGRKEEVTITNMCMVYDNNKVLIQNRVSKKYKGITFPGGHVEKGESFVDSVIREVKEETGLDIFSPVLCGVKQWPDEKGNRYIVLFYKTDKFKGEITSSSEGDVYWVDRDELFGMDLANGMRGMYEIFVNDKLSEFYFYQEDNEWKYVLK